ncbi:bifunctional hydroxymethylpyrimidine kinase/phosphomethylpyrimidine kinase [Natronogracilivirga saccharolytica]|uniref:hydroxymethylpyrimidine kinase n=1 Tax=Natronogracilivirga saccharolytica TaxID=2812953 RepID=A0A8J7UUM8_9BACT|nr:bifunctional hydroxymethylpyrimidine kinase/phosphomethylpyrimidine kinase [Natronogracilivirga saccharolytica]MBP3193791.1 bifunctional hydroxymethylpyrimidine kinase/phosphomethylpyrimidine kinase [Natronogracilivirga saccharolytica]
MSEETSGKVIPRTLTIAGSDSGGGAGIQADLKTFSALGCYGMSVLTAVTAQNTREVTHIHNIPPDIIRAQLDAIFNDIGADAVKIGMLSNSGVIRAVSDSLKQHKAQNIVLDTVMVAKSGDHLLQDDAVMTLKEELIPLSALVTPNIPEAEVLTGSKITSRSDMETAGKALLDMGPDAVLVKGGHLNLGSVSMDCLIYKTADGIDHTRWFELPRINTRNNHGTGCTLSSAIAAGLARELSLEAAVKDALWYLNEALKQSTGWNLGNGHGPVHHFHPWWQPETAEPDVS